MPPVLGLLLGLSLVGALQPDLNPPQHEPTEQGATLFASAYNSTAEIVLFKSVSASWNYYTNLTAENAALQVGGGTGAMPPWGRPQHQGLGGGWGMVGTLAWSPSFSRALVSAPRDGKPGLALVAWELQGFAQNCPLERLCPDVTALVLEQSLDYF